MLTNIIVVYANKIYNVLYFKLKKVKRSKKLVVNGRLYLSDGIKLSLGENVKINSGYKHNPVGDGITKIITENEGIVIVGNNVGISNTTIYAKTKICIEDDVLIGGGCQIYDTDFHSLQFLQRIKSDEKILSKEICIKRGAFIGAGAIILKGVTVGSQSVIGAGAVVAQDVPNDQIWAGNPARFIRNIER